MSEAPYLVADIGGTNARFALAYGNTLEGFRLQQVRRLKNEDFEDLRDAVHAYLESAGGTRPVEACLAVAGPVTSEVIRLTNSNWRFTATELARDLKLSRVMAINDFSAQARGALLTPSDELFTLNAGIPDHKAPCAVLGPGTGLGLGLLVPGPHGYTTVATEGGHAGFAPRSDMEIAVGKYIASEYGFASWERLLSGRGLVNIQRALCAIEGVVWPGHRPEDITHEALQEAHSLGRRVVDFFCAILGAYAGDVAVMSGARGGVYLGGGILPRIRDILIESPFHARFTRRGPMTRYAENIPIRLILSDVHALLGAAAIAEQGAL
jgi:glucokinase